MVRKTTVKTIFSFFSILIMWIFVWLLKSTCLDNYSFFSSETGSFIFWTTSKILIWVIPSLLLIKRSGKTMKDIVIPRSKKFLLWGLSVGFIVALINIMTNLISKQNIITIEMSPGFINIIVIAPLFEELLMRGYILENLMKENKFYAANIITSLLFVALHLPGWYFTGTLSANMFSFTGGAISIFAISLVIGFCTKKGESYWTGVIVHAINNFT